MIQLSMSIRSIATIIPIIYGHQHYYIHMHNSIGIRYVIFLVVMALMSVCYEDAISLPYDGCSIYLLTWMKVM